MGNRPMKRMANVLITGEYRISDERKIGLDHSIAIWEGDKDKRFTGEGCVSNGVRNAKGAAAIYHPERARDKIRAMDYSYDYLK